MASLDFLSAVPQKPDPQVRKHPELGDDPATHRWRAQWDTDYGGDVRGITLTAYPVIKLTPQGAWVDHIAWPEYNRDGLGWHLTGEKRWVSNTGGMAWAKPTQDIALNSIAIRLHRWAQKLHHDNVKIRQAIKVLMILRPEDAHWAKHALETINVEDDY